MDEDLIAHWCRTVAAAPVALSVGRDLLACYAQPQRGYHNAAHLREVLEAVEELAPYAADADAVRLAAWFHDAVYDGRPGEDEEASAHLAEERLPGCGVPPARIAEVSRLVRLTVAHAPADDDLNGAVLCDADLAILAADPQRYDRYVAGVRVEYAFVPEEAFRRGRQAVLERLLGRAELYRTPAARRWWTDGARGNLARELRSLS